MVFVKRAPAVQVYGSGPEFDGAEAKLIREQCGLTQDLMAHEMGVSVSTVQAWERAGHAYHFTSKPQRLTLALLMDAGRRRVHGVER